MLLAVDTSTQQVGLALYDGAQVIGEMNWRSKNHHTVEVAEAIDELFNRTGVKRDELTGLAVALGPGSFTSLRIGMALVKGLALSLHIPVVGIATHDILASIQPLSQYPLCAVIQAGRTRLAAGWYKNEKFTWVKNGEPLVLKVNELAEMIQEPTIVVGELSPEERQILSRKRKNIILSSPVLSVRRSAQLADLAWKRIRKNDLDDVVTISPIYLHVGDPIPE
ncbi:MAG: tRNA (adenosine(37)-N6)-threonylcarbamoyltransferase complex dimerization subunit type 1 TsaB [Anaerolineaceae bacterium]|nr:tRNA (adenosine(37)-N6)-threonylcarbamoyltransferase complex dimerization subunit type 1 TsaB [Anaerolineaceae bacterium]